jgi:mono/diheme cytochrome c family protein
MVRPYVAGLIFNLIMISATAAAGADSSDVERGKALAERLCASCHMNPSQGEKQGVSGVPGFRAVANRPNQTQEAVVRWIRSKPPMMPDHHISLDEAWDLAAFIMSLRSVP